MPSIHYNDDGTALLTADDGSTQVVAHAAVDATAAAFFPPAPLPDVPMYKIVHQLIEEGMLDQVNAYIAGLPQPQQAIALNLFTRAPNLVASSALPAAVQAALGKSDADYRAFVLAADALQI